MIGKFLDRVVGPLDEVLERVERAAKGFLSGDLSFGPLTLSGANAMDWAANLRVDALGVTLCLKLTTERSGWYFYVSPNATPWAAVLGCGPGMRAEHLDRIRDRLGVIADSPSRGVEPERLAIVWGTDLVGRPRGVADPPYIGSTEN